MKTLKILFIFVSLTLVGIAPALADNVRFSLGYSNGDYYDRGYHRGYHHRGHYRHYRHYDHYRPFYRHHYHRHYDRIPLNHVTIVYGGEKYFYSDGNYYQGAPQSYYTVPPPMGAVVHAIPGNSYKVTVEGVPYYINNGIYYMPVPGGYKVVEQPASQSSQPVAVSQPATQAPAAQEQGEESQEYVVNVPNSSGGYTAVTIKRTKDGYLGPDGEFYPEFPKVQQLKAMYAK